jgi:hypothetical protein
MLHGARAQVGKHLAFVSARMRFSKLNVDTNSAFEHCFLLLGLPLLLLLLSLVLC